MAQPNKQSAIKILLIGDSAVGKSSLMLRFVNNTFDPDISSTIGIDFKTRQVEVIDSMGGGTKMVTAQLWDTAGQERFRTLTSSYYRGAQAVVLVYDVNEPSSFEGLNKWLTEAKNFLGGESEVVFLLIGNKTDLVGSTPNGSNGGEGNASNTLSAPSSSSSTMAVPKEDAIAFAKQHGMLFAFCSAKTKEGVTHAFEEVVRKVYDKRSRSNRIAAAGGDGSGNSVNLGSGGGGGNGGGGGCC